MAPVALSAQPASFPALFSKQQPQSLKASLSKSASAVPRVLNGNVVSPAPADTFAFDSMDGALEAFQRGEFLVVMDDEGRENEGDLIIAADKITTEKMAWFIKHTRYGGPSRQFLPSSLAHSFSLYSGYICISLPQERLEALEIPMMVPVNNDKHKTAYTITVDYKHGTTTGISAHDRALTARMLASSATKPDDFSRPGHMVPLRAQPGGTLVRRGHTESALGTNFTRQTQILIAGLTLNSFPLVRHVSTHGSGARGSSLRACERRCSGHHGAEGRLSGVR